MFAQLSPSPSPSPSPANLTHSLHRRTFRNSTVSFSASPSTANSSRPPIQANIFILHLTLLPPLHFCQSKFRSFYQIFGGKDSTLDVTRKNEPVGFTLEANEEEIDWMNLEADIRLWTRALRPVQVKSNQIKSVDC